MERDNMDQDQTMLDKDAVLLGSIAFKDTLSLSYWSHFWA